MPGENVREKINKPALNRLLISGRTDQMTAGERCTNRGGESQMKTRVLPETVLKDCFIEINHVTNLIRKKSEHQF
jgi:hypothetical protein